MINDLIAATRLIDKEYERIDTSKYGKIYLFTNENISSMIRKLFLNGKNILTVCSSGDHVFNFLLEDIDSIEMFDINILTEYIFYLKKAAIESLTYTEFLDFFFPKHLSRKKVFTLDTYSKVRKSIKEQRIIDFWDYLFLKYGNKQIYNKNFFAELPLDKKSVIACNKYLNNEKNYNILKQKLKTISKIKFHRLDILRKIPQLDKKVNFLYLSNILGYIHSNSQKEYLKMIKSIIENLSSILKKDGCVGLCYLYCYLDNYWYTMNNNMQLSALEPENNNFLRNECQIIDFSGGLNVNSKHPKDRDALILYKKH